jgi:hypothetical protein
MDILKITRLVARAAVVATMLLVLGAGSAAAHMQTVDPNGNGEGFEDRPISKSWAQAHCQAASPLIIADRSGGVVEFTPPREFDNCVPGTRGQGD